MIGFVSVGLIIGFKELVKTVKDRRNSTVSSIHDEDGDKVVELIGYIRRQRGGTKVIL